MTNLHPSLNDIIPSVVTVVFRRYRAFVDLLNYSAIALMVLDKKWPELPND